MVRSKRGISVMVGYILLIVFAIVMGGVIYAWMKTYIPNDPLKCPDGVSIFIEDYGFNCTTNILNLSIRNNGRFSIAGYFIRGTENESQEISTIDLSSNLKVGGTQVGSAVLFSPSNENLITPDKEIKSVFNLTNKVYSVELIPVRFQEEDNRQRLVTCGNAKIKQEIICSKGDNSESFPETNYSKLLLHMDGSNTSTIFIDNSTSQHTIIANGNSRLDTDFKKFGTASGYFNNTDSFLRVENSNDWDFGIGNFTIDFWVRFIDVNQETRFITRGVASGGTASFYFDYDRLDNNLIRFLYSTTGSTWTNSFTTLWIPNIDNWYHFALIRKDSDLRLFINGNQIGSTYDIGSNVIYNGNEDINYIGYGNILLDEYRISKGIARWEGNFTPPTTPYE